MEEKENNLIIGIIDNYVKDVSSNWWIVFTTGVLFIVLGLIFLIWPEKSIVFVAYLIGVFCFLIGAWTINNALKVKKIEKNYQEIKQKIKNKFF